MKKNSIERLAFSAVIAAAGMALLFLSCVVPTMRLALVAAAGVLNVLVVLRFGPGQGALSWACCSVLALLLLPDRGNALLYALFFGHYPVTKLLVERLRNLPLEWAIKLLGANALITLAFGAASLLTGTALLQMTAAPALLYLGGNAAFIVFDLAFSRLIAMLSVRFRGKF